MVARFHYDEAVYQRLLADRLLPSEQNDVTRHVETCVACQSKLETLAEAGIDWGEVRRYLQSTETDLSGNAQLPTELPSEQANVWVGFLQESDHADSLGRFGRYEIKEILGRGGMGIVMRGYDPALDRHSAIKVLSPELAASAAARSRFSREAKSAAAVVHEHVVPIQTVDEHQGLPYLVMPVLEGKSLEERVRQRGPLEVKEVLRIGRQIAAGLAAAHAQGLVHRDIKPANILLHNGVERVVITDFGLARAADDASMTQSGALLGTPQYMSPEQAHGEDVDARSDLFSLGSVLYFMCAGHSPFRADTTMGVLNRIANDAPRSLRQINPDVPQWLEKIISKLLAKDAAARFQSAAEVEELLGQWLAHLQDPTNAPRPAEPWAAGGTGGRRAGKLIGAMFGGALLLLAGIFVVLETGKGTLTIESNSDDVAVQIRKGDEVQQRLTVTQGANRVRLAAGRYVVEIEGEHDRLTVENGQVTLTRGDEELVRIVERANGDAGDPIKVSSGPNFRNIGMGIGVPLEEETPKGMSDHDHEPISSTENAAGVSSFLAPSWLLGTWVPVETEQRKEEERERTLFGGIVLREHSFNIFWDELRKVGTTTNKSRRIFTGHLAIEEGKDDKPNRIAFRSHPGQGPHRVLHGTYQRDGDKLMITITAAENHLQELGPLPITWELQKLRREPPHQGRRRLEAIPSEPWSLDVEEGKSSDDRTDDQARKSLSALTGNWYEVIDTPPQHGPQTHDPKRLRFHGGYVTLSQRAHSQGTFLHLTAALKVEPGDDPTAGQVQFLWLDQAEATEVPLGARLDEPEVRKTYMKLEPLFRGTYRVKEDRLTITVQEVHQPTPFVNTVPAKWQFVRAPDPPAEAPANEQKVGGSDATR